MLEGTTLKNTTKTKENTAEKTFINEMLRNKYIRVLFMCGLLGGTAAGTIGCGEEEKKRVPYVSSEKEEGKGGIDWIDKNSEYSYDSDEGNLSLKLSYEGFAGNWNMQAKVFAVGEWDERGEAEGKVEDDYAFIETEIYVGKTHGVKSYVEIKVESIGHEEEIGNTVKQTAYLQINEDSTVEFIGTSWKGISNEDTEEEEDTCGDENTGEEE